MFLLHRRDRGSLNFRRRWTSAALLVAYAATAAGVPFPAGMRKHHSAELYPCSMSACGCTSADRCWRSCCCHTLAERLAHNRQYERTIVDMDDRVRALEQRLERVEQGQRMPALDRPEASPRNQTKGIN